jgi:glucosamine 6-phosphate synthetase-like amidotransferase/phosphosugar isomerase protein
MNRQPVSKPIFIYSYFFDLAIFLVLDDENLEQVLANILQVKERGATTIVFTNLPDIYHHVKPEKIDHLIKLTP